MFQKAIFTTKGDVLRPNLDFFAEKRIFSPFLEVNSAENARFLTQNHIFPAEIPQNFSKFQKCRIFFFKNSSIFKGGYYFNYDGICFFYQENLSLFVP